MPDLSTVGWLVVGLCAFTVGASKTGLPGAGILVVPLMAMVFPEEQTKQSVGVLLGVLILGDMFAAAYHRRNAQWGHVLRLLPATAAGIVAGWQAMRFVTNQQLEPIIGGIVLLMLGLNYWRTRRLDEDAPVPSACGGWWFAAMLGFAAGVTTMMANAAGPVMIIYLLAMQLPKFHFVGTSAWFFFIVNWVKVPFHANLDTMTLGTVKLDLLMLPLVAAGALAGIFLLKRIPQRLFNGIVQILAALAALKLVF